jgi:hypothetical protein
MDAKVERLTLVTGAAMLAALVAGCTGRLYESEPSRAPVPDECFNGYFVNQSMSILMGEQEGMINATAVLYGPEGDMTGTIHLTGTVSRSGQASGTIVSDPWGESVGLFDLALQSPPGGCGDTLAFRRRPRADAATADSQTLARQP